MRLKCGWQTFRSVWRTMLAHRYSFPDRYCGISPCDVYHEHRCALCLPVSLERSIVLVVYLMTVNQFLDGSILYRIYMFLSMGKWDYFPSIIQTRCSACYHQLWFNSWEHCRLVGCFPIRLPYPALMASVVLRYIWPSSWGPTYANSYGICVLTSAVCVGMCFVFRRHLMFLNMDAERKEVQRGQIRKGFRYLL